MAIRFSYNNFSFKQDFEEATLVVTGEITNESGKDFNAVLFKMTLFVKNRHLGNLSITMNGFRNGQTKTFRKSIGEAELGLGLKIATELIRYEIYPESAY